MNHSTTTELPHVALMEGFNQSVYGSTDKKCDTPFLCKIKHSHIQNGTASSFLCIFEKNRKIVVLKKQKNSGFETDNSTYGTPQKRLSPKKWFRNIFKIFHIFVVINISLSLKHTFNFLYYKQIYTMIPTHQFIFVYSCFIYCNIHCTYWIEK